MRAHLGDQLVIESPRTGTARRDGEIVGLHHEDGTPPYDVCWSDTDEVTLFYPGPDAHIHHLEHRQSGAARESQPDTGEAAVSPAAAPASGTADPGDIGRRVAAERRRQGMSREEMARRAGMSLSYLTYLEEQPADPTLATLIGLADALGTTVTTLRGGGMDLPPGRGNALLHPQLRDLGPEECRALLSTHGVGRVAVSASDGHPAVIPVNYEVIDDTIVFRTAPGTVTAAAADKEVAFEVDHVDDALSQGWSVLAVGPASTVTDPDTLRRLAQHAHTRPWAGGEREMWVSIRSTSLTGRRITSADQ
ncbi:pyridoxamine 5'-phosphate oxidase family protein [Streptomyces sp. NBC_00378]|uniref:pyridoxamine 5'-phosphate oxidase family protein n=1 Tax=unclassified Streptomyces TaxID=2593676 RepID=UPI002254D932|nr:MULTISPECIES: pyridoxamine 5'-phosphate oxidase family protein [unclassified Streptomyces]MCX5107787.1 pyridoxamine 5'-phosphate oxidase family protein [Streptomyces sp. NBC_00378]